MGAYFKGMPHSGVNHAGSGVVVIDAFSYASVRKMNSISIYI
jgi:hypothetical protein